MSNPQKQFTEILQDQGLVTPEQLAWAVQEEAKTGKSAWRVLLERGVVRERDLARARAVQFDMEFFDPRATAPQADALALIPPETARRQMALPVRVDGGDLVVAMAEPHNHLAVVELQTVSGRQVRPAAGYKPELVPAIEHFYGLAPARPAAASSSVPPAPAAPASPPPVPVARHSSSPQHAAATGRVDHSTAPAPAGNGRSPGPSGIATLAPGDLHMVEAPHRPPSAPAAPQAEESDRDPNLAAFLDAVIANGASDLHLTAGLPPMIRVHGELQPVEGFRKLAPRDLQEIVYSMLTQKQRETFEEHLELDLSYSLPGKARFRVNIFQQRDALGAVMRMIPFEIRGADQLGLPPAVEEFTKLRRGLVLVTGITGSGKSTTLAALLDVVNSERAEHIMTVEDPIEFLHKHKRSVVNQREVGTDTHGFAQALKHVLRQDPDVILVGELRDLETISTALTAAETGHLVFATLHTQDAPQSVDRVIDVFPPHQQEQIRIQLAGTIAGIVSQQLVPKANGAGRVVACEVLVATPAVRNLIREGKTHQIYTSMQAGGKFGMQVMDQHLAELVKKGAITYEVGLDRCHKVEEFNRLVGKG